MSKTLKSLRKKLHAKIGEAYQLVKDKIVGSFNFDVVIHG